jgi:uncharacterized repeat protein (TIGR03803 family)
MNITNRLTAVLCLFAAVLILGVGASMASTTEVIYSFAGEEDGEYADSDVAIDRAGNLYGSTVLGGDVGGGTVWQLARSGNDWVHSVLYSFTGGADGGEPYKGVTVDADGNLYGTAVTGGSGSCEGGCGVAYKLTKAGNAWSYAVIHAFTGGEDGSGPGARVTVDRQGNVYGMAPTGGEFGLGTIYQLHPNASGSYSFRLIHAFTGGDDGATGSAGKMVLRNRHLYGAATAGGAFGEGTIFELTRDGSGGWTFNTIYAFKGDPDAAFPYGGLLFDPTGNLYGTTYYDGAHEVGAVYQLSQGSSGSWTEQVLYSFKPQPDVNSSISNLVADVDGNLYGTGSEGGLGSGGIFKLARGQSGNWVETVEHRFQGPPDGAFPYNGMTRGTDGSFYGATVHGGEDDEGAVYKFTP